MNLIPISILIVSIVCIAVYLPRERIRFSYLRSKKRHAKLARESQQRTEKLKKLIKAVEEINKYCGEIEENDALGTDAEKSGDIAKAIVAYETNVTNKAPAQYSYNRLMTIYHRERRYEDEIRVINTALDVFGTESEKNDDTAMKWLSRLDEAKRLLNKSKQPLQF